MTTTLHVSDWNNQDKAYTCPISVLIEFKATFEKAEGDENKKMNYAWDWFVTKVDFNGTGLSQPPVKIRNSIPIDEEVFFLDFNNPTESFGEWEFE